MGKTLIQQARGRAGPRYRTKKKAFRICIKYPSINYNGEAEILKLLNVSCYRCPIAKIKTRDGEIFYNVAVRGLLEGQKIMINLCNGNPKIGDILPLGLIPVGLDVCNLESYKGSGGKFVRTSGISAKIIKKENNNLYLKMPSGKEKILPADIRATIGIVAAGGRKEKPILKAGKMVYIKGAIGGKVYPRTSAVKMNVIDHPFGSGRGKRIKSKIPKRNVPPGAKVGLLRARRTGRG